MQNNLKNPVMLARRVEALEVMNMRQIALNGAAADKLIRLQELLDERGSYIIALLKRLGGRAEFTVPELQEIAGSGMRVHYRYPDEKDPNFLMVLSAEGAKPGDPRTEQELEEKLRAAGVPQEEIDAAKRAIDDGAAQAETAFGGGGEPLTEVQGGPAIVDPSGRTPEAG